MMSKRWMVARVVLLSVAALTAGCSNEKTVAGPDIESTPSEITVPLTVGNMWVYTTDLDTTAVQSSAADTSRIVGTETHGDETYYVLENVTIDGTERSLVRQRGQEILIMPVSEKTMAQDPFQEWMDQITAASMPWKVADLDAPAGSQWVEVDATSQFTLGGSDVTVRYEVRGASLGRVSVSVPTGDYADAYLGEFTTRLTLYDPSGLTISGMTSRQKSWIADGVGILKEVYAGSWEVRGEGNTITKTSELIGFELR